MHPLRSFDRIIQIDDLVAVYNYIRPKGFYFPGESHDFWECVYIHEGEVTATADERVYQLDSGKLLIHKPMEFHRIWTNEDCTPWVINISFRAHGKLTEKLSNRCFDLNPSQQKQFFEIAKLFSAFEAANEDPHSHKYHRYLNRIAVLLELFLMDLSAEEYTAPSKLPNDERYSKIVQIMQNHRDKNLSLAELAKLCEMSISNMKRIFQMYSDVGIAKYFLTMRIRYAMELLENGISANQVAEILNFSDATYFYTVFKRETGITPSAFQKSKRI